MTLSKKVGVRRGSGSNHYFLWKRTDALTLTDNIPSYGASVGAKTFSLWQENRVYSKVFGHTKISTKIQNINTDLFSWLCICRLMHMSNCRIVKTANTYILFWFKLCVINFSCWLWEHAGCGGGCCNGRDDNKIWKYNSERSEQCSEDQSTRDLTHKGPDLGPRI